MNPASHVSFNNGDPKDRGTFDTEIVAVVPIVTGGKATVNIPSARINFVYQLKASNDKANAFFVKLYNKTARAATNLIYTSGSQAAQAPAEFIEQNSQGSRLIVAVDDDKTENIFLTVEGTNGDTVTVTMRVVRLT